MKVAIVYDRVNKWGGAERVLLSLHEIFPDAPLFTSVYSQEGAGWARVFPEVIPSFLQKIPFVNRNHELFPFLMPFAFESHNMSDFDLVISVTSEASKGVITGGKHICYCLTPTRYLWSGYDDYFRNPLLRVGTRPIISYLRRWDRYTSNRPDIMVSISSEVRKRIKKYYGRDSQIIFPPVDLEKFKTSGKKKKEDFFLIVSRLVSYKKVDLAIEAFNDLGYSLVIVGTGREEGKLRKMARPNIKFAGQLTDDKLAHYYSRCKALVFPQEEDFGIVAVEAQAAGAPVVAFKRGGALDTVIEGKTGVFFYRQEKEDLKNAIERIDRMKFNRNNLVRNARRFSSDRFKKEFLALVKLL